MRKWLYSLFALAMIALGSQAQIVTTLPFQLQNNTVADATQVMANFNQIVQNVNANAAKSGTNSDITAILGLVTPLSPTLGGTSVFLGGLSVGAPNAQVVSTTVPNSFALVAGYRVSFFAGATNTAPTTLNVNATGVKNLYRQTVHGIVPMAGGELIIGALVEAVYDGTQYQVFHTLAGVQPGQMIDYVSGTVPAGYVAPIGQDVSNTTYATLCTLVGTTYGPGTGSTCTLPDLRARVMVAPDAAANRITVAGAGCSAVLGAACVTVAQQSYTLLTANLPAVPPTGTVVGTALVNLINGTSTLSEAGVVVGAGFPALNGTTGTPVDIRGNISATFTGANLGTATPFSKLVPLLVITKLLKY